MKAAGGLSEMDGAELGMADGVVARKPETIDETKEPPEFFQGTCPPPPACDITRVYGIAKLMNNM